MCSASQKELGFLSTTTGVGGTVSVVSVVRSSAALSGADMAARSHGSDADYLLTDERNCLPLPDELSFEVGALLACNTAPPIRPCKNLVHQGATPSLCLAWVRFERALDQPFGTGGQATFTHGFICLVHSTTLRLITIHPGSRAET